MQEGYINGWGHLGFLVRHIWSMKLIDSLKIGNALFMKEMDSDEI